MAEKVSIYKKRNFALGCQYCFMQVVRNRYLDNI